jgi:hypothetical protein
MRGDETVQEACEIPLDEQEDTREEHEALLNAVEEVVELQDGYEFRLPSDPRWLREAAVLMANEYECCPFFRLELVAEPDAGPILLRFRSQEAMERGFDEELADIFG